MSVDVTFAKTNYFISIRLFSFLHFKICNHQPRNQYMNFSRFRFIVLLSHFDFSNQFVFDSHEHTLSPTLHDWNRSFLHHCYSIFHFVDLITWGRYRTEIIIQITERWRGCGLTNTRWTSHLSIGWPEARSNPWTCHKKQRSAQYTHMGLWCCASGSEIYCFSNTQLVANCHWCVDKICFQIISVWMKPQWKHIKKF